MSNVSLKIGGHSFAVACAPGEEEHVRKLGDLISDKLNALPNLGTQNESRMLLFASLLLADEVHELRKGPPASPAASGSDFDASSALALEELAQRFEKLADIVEGLA